MTIRCYIFAGVTTWHRANEPRRVWFPPSTPFSGAATKDIENIKGVRTVESAGGETRETCYCRVYQKRPKHMFWAAWLSEIGHNKCSKERIKQQTVCTWKNCAIILFMLIVARLFPKRTYLRFSEICAPDNILPQALIFRIDFKQSAGIFRLISNLFLLYVWCSPNLTHELHTDT